MTPANPHSTAREDGSCDDCGSFHGVRREEIPPELHRWARTDAYLSHLLRLVTRRAEHHADATLAWAAKEYLKLWPATEEMLVKMEVPTEHYRALWPTWDDGPGCAMRDRWAERTYAVSVIATAANIRELVFLMLRRWVELQPPEPIMVTRAQAIAMGFAIEPSARA